MHEDLCFGSQHGVFCLRSAAIICHRNHILLSQGERDDFWVLPGGRVKSFETCSSSLEREVSEETGFRVKAERLVWIVESFYEYRAERYHEVTFYFKASPSPQMVQHMPHTVVRQDTPQAGPRLTLRWHDLCELSHVDINPTFLSTALSNVPDTLTHVVLVNGVPHDTGVYPRL